MIFYTNHTCSTLLEIVKVRYRGDNYMRCMVRYWSKPGLTLLWEEKNVKITKQFFEHNEKVKYE